MRKPQTYTELDIYIHSMKPTQVRKAVKAMKAAMKVLDGISDVDVTLTQTDGVTKTVYCPKCLEPTVDYSHACTTCGTDV